MEALPHLYLYLLPRPSCTTSICRPPAQPPPCVSGNACVQNWIHAAAEVLRTRRTFTGADPFWIYFKDQWANWLEGGDH